MLKAGFSRVDVTPPLGTSVWGYFYDRKAKGVLDPIELNAIALSDGKEKAVIVIADFEGIERKVVKKLKKRISEATGLKSEFIILHTTHSHTSIGLVEESITPFDNNVFEDKNYLDLLYRKFVDVSVMALDDMSDAVWSYAEKETDEQISFVRRYLMQNGLVHTNPYGFEDQIVKPSEEPDNTVRLMRFKREGKKDIAFVNFATHTDVVTGEYFSADWPGFLRRNVENDIEDTLCAVMVGFQGDTNHVNFMGEKKRGLQRSIEMGRIIADTVIDIWDKTEDGEDFELYGAVATVYNKTNTDKEEYYDECLEFTTNLNEEGKPRTSKSPSGISYVEALRVVDIREIEPIYKKIPISVLSMGKFSIVGIGCEAFTNYARAVRDLYPDKTIFTASLLNGAEGYLPTKVAYAYGGYEVITSPFSPSVEEECIEAIKNILK